MASQYDQDPEVAPHNFPEVANPPHHMHGNSASSGSPQFSYQQPYQVPQSPVKPEQVFSAVDNGYGPGYAGSPYSQHAGLDGRRRSAARENLICGCVPLVFIMSCIIAVLSAAVIGLAAGTGIEASRANSANNKLAVLNSAAAQNSGGATVTVTAINPKATAFNNLDNGCSDTPQSVTGTEYQSFSRKRYMPLLVLPRS
jgi:hypothetical protein